MAEPYMLSYRQRLSGMLLGNQWALWPLGGMSLSGTEGMQGGDKQWKGMVLHTSTLKILRNEEIVDTMTRIMLLPDEMQYHE